MHFNINFPHLGIHLEHVGKSITVFGFEIAFYGIIIGCAILIGFLIATSEAKRTRQNPEDYLDMGIIGVVCGIAGARLYYVIFSWDMYKDNLLDILNLREGGLGNLWRRDCGGDYGNYLREGQTPERAPDI